MGKVRDRRLNLFVTYEPIILKFRLSAETASKVAFQIRHNSVDSCIEILFITECALWILLDLLTCNLKTSSDGWALLSLWFTYGYSIFQWRMSAPQSVVHLRLLYLTYFWLLYPFLSRVYFLLLCLQEIQRCASWHKTYYHVMIWMWKMFYLDRLHSVGFNPFNGYLRNLCIQVIRRPHLVS